MINTCGTLLNEIIHSKPKDTFGSSPAGDGPCRGKAVGREPEWGWLQSLFKRYGLGRTNSREQPFEDGTHQSV